MSSSLPAPHTRVFSAINLKSLSQVLSFHHHGGEEGLEFVAMWKRPEVPLRGSENLECSGQHDGFGNEVLSLIEETADHDLVLVGLARTGGVDQPSARANDLRGAA